MAVKTQSTLLGHLAKSGKGQSTPQDGDSQIIVPGMTLLTLECPFPLYALLNTPQPGGEFPYSGSFTYGESAQFNANNGVVMFAIGPGLWDITFLHRIEEQGAVSDPASKHIISIIDSLTGRSTNISTITNKQGIEQNNSLRLRILIPADTNHGFVRTASAGGGLGVNRFNVFFACVRLF